LRPQFQQQFVFSGGPVIAEPLRDLAVPLDQLRPLEGNPRRGDVAAVARSLRRFGQRKPVVARADGTVIAGNHMLAAARELGWAELAVTRVDDDDATAKAFALADNRTAELGSFDLGDLAAMAADVQAADPALLAAASYSEEDLNALLAGVEVPAKLTDPDAVPEPPAEPVTRPGDLWLLGPHRLLCGDAMVATDVERLLDGGKADCMWTDPPYGVDYVGKTADALTIKGDDQAGLSSLLRGAFAAASTVLKPGAALYIAHPAGALCTVFLQAFQDAGWRLHETLVWVKDVFVLGHADYHYQHEPILYGYTACEGRRGRGGAGWYGGNDQASVFAVPRPKRSETHPTMKPVDLIEPHLRNSCPPGGTVLDLFGGSGSTLLAAHGTGRVARLMDLDPTYVDVACRRYQEHTGTKPVLEATGEPHDFTA
jgi:DNA modification methylase